MFQTIDMTTYPRLAHFQFFSHMANPYVGVTVQVDITEFRKKQQERGLPFFLSFLYCIGRAANAVPQLRQRIADGGIIEFDRCDTSHTVMQDNGTYGYCRLNCCQPFSDYLPQAICAHEMAKQAATLDDGDDGNSLFFISCLPWISYTALQQPIPYPADSNPRITWGKYTENGGKLTLPVSLLAHHALVDGSHLGLFYEALARELANF